MPTDGLVGLLRERAAAGASLVELVDLVHEVEQVPRYNRGILLRWFSEAFALLPQDFTSIIFACEIFGDGASMEIAEAERLFRDRVSEILNQQGKLPNPTFSLRKPEAP